MDAHFGYMAVVTDQPRALADYYAKYFDMWELGHSDEGDVSITDGFLNVSLLKQRLGVEGASGRPGLSHFGIAVSDVHELEANLEEYAPDANLEAEPGDLHHGEYRVYGPNGLPVSVSTKNFGVTGNARRLPRIRHMALSFPPSNDPQTSFLCNVFGFREITTSMVRRKYNSPVRFVGDGNICLALLSMGGGGLRKAGLEQGFEDTYGNNDERALNTKSGLQHFGFVVEDQQAVMDAMPPELARWTNKREARDMAEYRVFDPDLNGIDLSQRNGFEVDFDRWETAAATLSGEAREAALAR